MKKRRILPGCGGSSGGGQVGSSDWDKMERDKDKWG